MDPTLRSLLLAHLQAENAHDMPATLATLHPECVFEDVTLGQMFRGREGAARYYSQWWDAFDLVFDREHAQHRWTTDGNCVAEGLFTGRHIGTFLGHAPTGRSVQFQFVVLVEFRDGLLSGERFYYDLSCILRQLEVHRPASQACSTHG